MFSSKVLTLPLVGRIVATVSDVGVARLTFVNRDDDKNRVVGATPTSAPTAQQARHMAAVESQLREYLTGARKQFTLPLDWQFFTPFGRRAAGSLLNVEYGSVVTYGELAMMMGSPGAARAVGNAMAANPLGLVVPCHRVVRSGGDVGQYGGGADLKRRLLELEGHTAVSFSRLAV